MVDEVEGGGHAFEVASSGRSKCRGCGGKIGKGEIRLGERLPNPFAEGETMVHWFHPDCAAFKRPEPFLEALVGAPAPPEDAERLEAEARRGLEHRRLPRVSGAGRAPTARARCRSCREMIGKGAWRVALVYYEEGRFEPSGFIHAGCARSYFETADIAARVRRFSPELGDDDLAELQAELDAGGGSGVRS